MVTRLLARVLPIAAAGLTGIASPGVSAAAPDGSAVSGVIELASLAERPELPVRSRGFVGRTRGPLKPPRRADPRDRIIVVLDGGPVASEDKKPPSGKQRYELIGESFARPVFPFVAGASLEIKNSGHTAPRLYSPDRDDIVEETPINPRGVRPIRAKLSEPLAPVELRDRDSAHIRGLLVPMPHAYFGVLDESGNYQIEGVPAGEWTIKLWYRGGFIDLGKKVRMTVAGRSTKAPTIVLPPNPRPKARLEAE
jgi:hypothetical protein